MEKEIGRRSFFIKIFQYVSGISVVAFLGHILYRYLVPFYRKKKPSQKMFIGFIDEVGIGLSKGFHTPEGEHYLLVRKTKEHLVAYSSRCPHLGCRVRWEGKKKRFFCPCHNGIFDEKGIAIAGPPAKAGQRLAKLSLEIKNGVVYGVF